MRHIRYECINIDRRYQCVICPSKFRRKEDLNRHLRTKHGNLTENPFVVTFRHHHQYHHSTINDTDVSSSDRNHHTNS